MIVIKWAKSIQYISSTIVLIKLIFHNVIVIVIVKRDIHLTFIIHVVEQSGHSMP